MRGGWIFGPGLALLLILGVVVGRRLPSEYRNRLGPSIRTVGLVWTFYAVHFGLVVLAAAESTWHVGLPSPVAPFVGIALAAAGGAMHLSAACAFRSLRRMSGLENTGLVTRGIYRWSRNPQHVAWTLVVVGLGLARESGMVLLLAAVFWLSFRLYLPLEEALLARRFGTTYAAYRRRTPRYFGLPGRDDAA